MDYYPGGYLLLHCLPIQYPESSLHDKPLLTFSTCFNESLLDSWAYSWCCNDKDTLYDANTTLYEHLESRFLVDDATRERIHVWADTQFNEGNIGWVGVFMNAASAIEYKKKFFPYINDCYLLAAYFNERDSQHFLHSYSSSGNMGVLTMLARRQPEKPNGNEKMLGYDILGLDLGGEFHTSHCHNISDDLHHRFGLILNQYGLYDTLHDWQSVVDYMNADTTACEPVPWCIAKIKQVIF